MEELAETESMNLAAAEKVYAFFHSDQEAQETPETAVEERPQIWTKLPDYGTMSKDGIRVSSVNISYPSGSDDRRTDQEEQV